MDRDKIITHYSDEATIPTASSSNNNPSLLTTSDPAIYSSSSHNNNLHHHHYYPQNSNNTTAVIQNSVNNQQHPQQLSYSPIPASQIQSPFSQATKLAENSITTSKHITTSTTAATNFLPPMTNYVQNGINHGYHSSISPPPLQNSFQTTTSNSNNNTGTPLAYRDPIPPNPHPKSEIPWTLDRILEVKDAYNILYEPNPDTVKRINDSLNEFLDEHNLRQKSLRNQGFPPELRWECICGRKYGTGAGCWYHLHKSARSCDAIDYVCLIDGKGDFKSRGDVEKYIIEKHGWIPPPVEKKKGKGKKGKKGENPDNLDEHHGEKGSKKTKKDKKDKKSKKDKIIVTGNRQSYQSNSFEDNYLGIKPDSICKVENSDDYQIIEVGDESMMLENQSIPANTILQSQMTPKKSNKKIKKEEVVLAPPPLPKAPKIEAHYINENGQEQSYYDFSHTPPPPIITKR